MLYQLFSGFLFFAAIAASAQEDSILENPVTNYCTSSLLSADFDIQATLSTRNSDEKPLTLAIQWKHRPVATDTFVIFSQRQTLTYRTGYSGRWLDYSKPERASRRLGFHHLREKVLDSDLLLDDLELLARGHYQCRDSITSRQTTWLTAQSQAWTKIRLAPSGFAPDIFQVIMEAGKRRRREINVMDWELTSAGWIPRRAISGNSKLDIVKMETPTPPMIDPIFHWPVYQ